MRLTPREKTVDILNRIHMVIIKSSILYYNDGTSPMTDEQFDTWSKLLVSLQRRFPAALKETRFYEYFKDWDGSTGMHLLDLERVIEKGDE